MVENERPDGHVRPLLLTPRQAAKVLAVSERTLWTLTKTKKVRCVRLGRSVRYHTADLEELIDRQKV